MTFTHQKIKSNKTKKKNEKTNSRKNSNDKVEEKEIGHQEIHREHQLTEHRIQGRRVHRSLDAVPTRCTGGQPPPLPSLVVAGRQVGVWNEEGKPLSKKSFGSLVRCISHHY